MPQSPLFPTIPMPAAEVDALYNTCMTLKDAVETLQGVRGTTPAARVFIQVDPPSPVRDGDFWLTLGVATVLNISQGGRWLVVGTLT